MRKLLLLLLCAGAVLAAEEGAKSHEAGENLTAKWVNFAILAGGLGYLAVKVGGPVFQAKKLEILDALNEGVERAKAAEAKVAEIDRRLSNLPGEVEAMRVKAMAEMASEVERVRRETVAHAEKLQQAAQQEIQASAKAARQELKAQASGLAVDLAGRKVAARMDDTQQATLVSRFTSELKN